jgi:hypothetical protein
LIADGVSMGFGEFLSGDAEKKYILSERGREAWEMKNNPTGEIEEMIELYQTKGFDLEHATTIVTAMSTNKEFFIDHMMVQEYVVRFFLNFLVCSFGFVSHAVLSKNRHFAAHTRVRECLPVRHSLSK